MPYAGSPTIDERDERPLNEGFAEGGERKRHTHTEREREREREKERGREREREGGGGRGMGREHHSRDMKKDNHTFTLMYISVFYTHLKLHVLFPVS